MQTITEGDIIETQLWHEYQGHQPSTRNQNPHKQWKTNKNITNYTPAVILKGAGIGWGSCRGKVIAERVPGAPGEMQKMTSNSNYGSNSSTRHNSPHYFHTPLQHNNEKWRPSFGKGTRVAEPFKPNQPQVYNVRQVVSRGETRTGETSRSNQPETNNVWRVRNFGQRETGGPGPQARNHLARNNVWQASSFGRGDSEGAWTSISKRAINNGWPVPGSRGETQAAWTSSSNESANSNVWRATSSKIGETRAAVTSRPDQPTNIFRGSSRSDRGINWRSGYN